MTNLEKRDALIGGFCEVIGKVLGEEFPKEDGQLLLEVLESGAITVRLSMKTQEAKAIMQEKLN